MKRWYTVLFWLMLASPMAIAQEYKLEEIATGVHRFTAGPYHSVVWATDDGLAVIDPLSTEAATWLKGELRRRFSQPLRYVIYSHNHYDHSYGGEALDGPGVTFVSHEMARLDLVESAARTRIPELTFKEQLTLHLGGQSLRLSYHGPNNGRGSVSCLFEQQRLLFVVDWIVVGRMPWKDLQGYDIAGMIASTREVLGWDWDTFVGGHAEVGDKAAVRRYLSYLEALYEAVRDGMIAGKSLEELQAEIRLDEFRDLAQYEAWLPLNIGGVYRTLADQSYILMRPEVKARQGTAVSR